jgi:hypothetical protein
VEHPRLQDPSVLVFGVVRHLEHVEAPRALLVQHARDHVLVAAARAVAERAHDPLAQQVVVRVVVLRRVLWRSGVGLDHLPGVHLELLEERALLRLEELDPAPHILQVGIEPDGVLQLGEHLVAAAGEPFQLREADVRIVVLGADREPFDPCGDRC